MHPTLAQPRCAQPAEFTHRLPRPVRQLPPRRRPCNRAFQIVLWQALLTDCLNQGGHRRRAAGLAQRSWARSSQRRECRRHSLLAVRQPPRQLRLQTYTKDGLMRERRGCQRSVVMLFFKGRTSARPAPAPPTAASLPGSSRPGSSACNRQTIHAFAKRFELELL